MAKLPTFKGRIPTVATHRIKLAPKTVDAVYQTPEHRAWRDAVLARAGHRCEARDDRGQRCTKATPLHRMFADHIREIKDGGALHDLENGQCLCGSHHTAKTAQRRADRRFSR